MSTREWRFWGWMIAMIFGVVPLMVLDMVSDAGWVHLEWPWWVALFVTSTLVAAVVMHWSHEAAHGR